MTTRHRATATAISWIPSEAVRGMSKLPFDRGLAHYDDPPPERLDGPAHLEDLRANDRFRFANALNAWIEVTDGAITAAGQDGGGMIGVTTLAIAGTAATFAAVPYNDIVGEPVRQGDAVRFTQTAGGRTGLPTPRRVNRPPSSSRRRRRGRRSRSRCGRTAGTTATSPVRARSPATGSTTIPGP